LSDLTGSRIFCSLTTPADRQLQERGPATPVALDPTSEPRSDRCFGGNHALALACHGRDLGIPVTVVMPRFAPLIKIATCRRYGANVVLHGGNFAEAKAQADSIASDRGLTYIHGFDDPAVIAGQGTIAWNLDHARSGHSDRANQRRQPIARPLAIGARGRRWGSASRRTMPSFTLSLAAGL
jgi:threonine dehydratase